MTELRELTEEFFRNSSVTRPSLWLQEQHRDYSGFSWQGDYADFGVSQSNIEEEMDYIANQEHHHRKMTFQEELRAFLGKHNQEWDERYVWD